jgi:FKBP-type peptidyl-prolyl cis-trans isomerase
MNTDMHHQPSQTEFSHLNVVGLNEGFHSRSCSPSVITVDTVSGATERQYSFDLEQQQSHHHHDHHHHQQQYLQVPLNHHQQNAENHHTMDHDHVHAKSEHKHSFLFGFSSSGVQHHDIRMGSEEPAASPMNFDMDPPHPPPPPILAGTAPAADDVTMSNDMNDVEMMAWDG